MSHVEVCKKHGQYHGEYCGECVELIKALLEESLELLCSHDRVAHLVHSNPSVRIWCDNCRTYLRKKEDATLVSRIKTALSFCKF